jgi:hypothetical protein|tara:strand:- start:4109 stop:4387 length:279 start_codon:yes stop_codon:yes gene_type:complete
MAKSFVYLFLLIILNWRNIMSDTGFDTIQIKIDDWWCQLFALRIGAPPPSKKTKLKFIVFAESYMEISGATNISDEELSILFSEFIEDLGSW